MSDRITTLRTANEAQAYFSEQFRKMFPITHCAMYRVSERDDTFYRTYDFAASKANVQPKAGDKITLSKAISDDKDTFVILHHQEPWFVVPRQQVKQKGEVLLLIRNAEKVVAIIHGIAPEPIPENGFQNDTARVFSNFFIQVEGGLQLRTQINEHQIELSGHIANNNDTLFQLNERLIQYNEELQQFAYSASHDLQEPLRNIASYINLFIKQYGSTINEEGLEYLQFASDGAQRMQQLIRDLLTYNKLDQQQEPMALFEGNQMLQEALYNLRMSVEESNALILYPELPVLYGNPSQIILLFQNLIDNAIKFRKNDEPLIFIEMEEKPEHWEFKVVDNGMGIAAQYQQKIFGVFYRMHGPDQIRGSGLGLSICKKIVERHHGTIKVDSKPGKGTTFIFSIGKNQ